MIGDRGPRLYARTVEIPDPGPLEQRMPRDATAAWLRHGAGMIGIGRAATFRTFAVDHLAEAEAWWSEVCERIEGQGARAFGAFTFDPTHTQAESTLVLPELVVGRTAGRSWLTSVSTDPDLVPTLPQPQQIDSMRGEVSFGDGALTGLEWEGAVAAAVRLIQTDGLDKVVLARDLTARTEAPIDPRRLVAALARDYTRCWTYAIDGLVGSTPEMLIRREGGLATSRVLAGTIRRTGDDGRDLALAAALAQSSKDLEEHDYAVASVAERLAPFCSGMNVPDSPYVLALPNVLHLATDVTAVAGHQHDGAAATVLRMAGALHPSAAVCGTPTDRARGVIAELERMDRERYTGPVGWVDADGDGEWGIALRCGQISTADPHQIRLFAGCGIVAGSDPVAELSESNAKLVPMRDALAG